MEVFMETEYNFYSLVLMVIAISFLGWCFENIWLKTVTLRTEYMITTD